MRLSRLVGLRLKETPAEATSEGEALLLRGGYLRRMATGGYGLLPAGVRVVRNIERLLREAVERLGGQEVWLEYPYAYFAIMLYARELNSYTQLPSMLYHARISFAEYHSTHQAPQTVPATEADDGYRDSFASYAFFATAQEALEGYAQFRAALAGVFAEAGLAERVMPLESAGHTPEAPAEDYVIPNASGEDIYAEGPGGAWRAALEAVSAGIPGYPEPPRPLEKVHTPGAKTIRELADFLKIEPRQTGKVVLYRADKEGRPVMALIRGDREVNEFKLGAILGMVPQAAGEDDLAKFQEAGVVPGFASPLGIDSARCRIIIDHSVRTSNNLAVGANEPDMHDVNFNLERDLPGVETVDIALAAEGDLDATGAPITLHRGTRLAELRWTGTHLTEAQSMSFRDREGTLRNPFLVRFSADIGRVLDAVIETHHDQYGPLWPAAVAPWPVHIGALRLDAPGVREAAEGLYEGLKALGIEALYDDRNAQPGVQFAEADLLGAPLRVTVGERGLKQGAVEWKRRATGESGMIPIESAAQTIAGWITH